MYRLAAWLLVGLRTETVYSWLPVSVPGSSSSSTLPVASVRLERS